MSKQLRLRRGTTAEHSEFTGAEGEITVDTDKDTLVVHDGATAGGFPLLKESAYTAADVLTKIKTVNGAGSGLDSDTVDGMEPSGFPISVATQAALNLKANSADTYTKDQTDSAISTAIELVIDSAPAALDTLNELAAALGDNADYAAAITTTLATKVDKVEGKGLSAVDYSIDDKAKVDGIEANAQVNTVNSVAGKIGAVTLVKADVGLDSVDNTADNLKQVLSATKLTTARTINGVLFDGTSNIVVGSDSVVMAIALG